MDSIFAVLMALAVVMPLATPQYINNCYVNVCGMGGQIPLIDTMVPPGYQVIESAPEGYCYGYPVTGITTTVCAADETPIVSCRSWGSVVVARLGMPGAPARISMAVTCGYPSNWMPPLAFKSTQDSAVPKAEKLA